VAVRAESEMREIEHRRRSGNLLKGVGVSLGRTFNIRFFHRHGVDLHCGQRCMFEQTLSQLRQVPIGGAGGRYPFVDLHYVHRFPRYSLVRQGAQHLPRRVATADRHYEATTCGHRGARLGCNHLGGLLGDGIGIGKDFGLYGDPVFHN
jgi:hypothetical protein